LLVGKVKKSASNLESGQGHGSPFRFKFSGRYRNK
jgi:hypothetical protein